MNDCEAAALEYAGRGWAVFPVKRDKTPRTEHGFKDATTDPQQIRVWWERWPDAGVGVRTGAGSGLLVLDVDGEAGADALRELERRHGEPPVTAAATTGGGGRHVYFAHPGGDIRNTAKKLGPGLDTRGDGGYVVGPPSAHESGGAYAWESGRHPGDVGIAPPPGWMLGHPGDRPGQEGQGAAGERSKLAELLRDPPAAGERNEWLAKVAGHHAKAQEHRDAYDALVGQANHSLQEPLPEGEVAKLADSIWGTEQAKLAAGDEEEAPEPDPDVDVAELLSEVETFLGRYIVATGEQLTAMALWIAHTHAIDAAEQTPYLNVRSPEKQSGKTRALEVLELLVPRPERWGARPSEAVVYRAISAFEPTLLLDEVDAIWNDRYDEHEGLRAVLNSGNRRGATVPRCIGSAGDKIARFPVFCPKVLAGIGELPDTVADRSIPIVLKRRTEDEPVERFRRRAVREEGTAESLKRRAGGWGAAATDELRDARPDLPEELTDREQESVEPLLAIADLAAGEWPERARTALTSVIVDGRADASDSRELQLLSDLREVWLSEGWPEFLASTELVRGLLQLSDAPWSDPRRPLTEYWLARHLRAYRIRPVRRRQGNRRRHGDGDRAKGYNREDLEEVWRRYLPAPEGGSPDPAPDPAQAGLPLDEEGE
jgi:hypothetical protein